MSFSNIGMTPTHGFNVENGAEVSQCLLAAHMTPTWLPDYVAVCFQSQCLSAAHITPTEDILTLVEAI